MAKMDLGIETGSWINIVAGIVIAVVGYYQTTSNDATFWSAAAGGALLVAAGAYTAWAAATDRGRTAVWPSLVSLVAGLWLAGYPWFVGVTDAYFYTSVGVGIVAAVTSGYEMYAAFRSEQPMRPRSTV